MEDSKPNKFIVPGAILIAGLIIAGAIYYDKKTPQTTPQDQVAAPAASPLDNLKPVATGDHILGNPDAPLTFVLFTDLECPFCKNFHLTMKRIMDEYGKTGKLKWVFRHLPLTELHSKAKDEAVATECANELGGNEAFWKYVDRIFEITPSNNGLDLNELPKIADYIGLNKTQFTACLKSGKFNQLVDDERQDAIKSGARGTPYGILIGKDGKKSVIGGALPYSDVKAAIDEMLANSS